MYLTRLQLTNLRSWRRLELALEPGLTLIVGDNASGKSNLIEAVYLLAALRSTRASVEGDLVAWQAVEEARRDGETAVARIAGEARRRDGGTTVEIALQVREGQLAGAYDTSKPSRRSRRRSGAPTVSKRIRVNGVARRAADALGAIRAVPFSTADVDLLTGAAALRRRFLDVVVGQLNPPHAGALSRYQRALTQRNALLRQIGQGAAAAAQLEQWDDLAAREAGPIWQARAEAASWLADRAAQRHRALQDANEALHLSYQPALSDDREPPADPTAWAAAMRDALRASRARDLARGVTHVGPHRDDLLIDLDDRPVGIFGSRAQQRAAALALRLAETDFLAQRSGDPPLLLLDDLFSELDADRAERVSSALQGHEQVILTTALPDSLPAVLGPITSRWRIDQGRLV